MTRQSTPFSAGMINYAKYFTIPPGKPSHPIENQCCYSGFEILKGFAFRVHTHALGRSALLPCSAQPCPTSTLSTVKASKQKGKIHCCLASASCHLVLVQTICHATSFMVEHFALSCFDISNELVFRLDHLQCVGSMPRSCNSCPSGWVCQNSSTMVPCSTQLNMSYRVSNTSLFLLKRLGKVLHMLPAV